MTRPVLLVFGIALAAGLALIVVPMLKAVDVAAPQESQLLGEESNLLEQCPQLSHPGAEVSPIAVDSSGSLCGSEPGTKQFWRVVSSIGQQEAVLARSLCEGMTSEEGERPPELQQLSAPQMKPFSNQLEGGEDDAAPSHAIGSEDSTGGSEKRVEAGTTGGWTYRIRSEETSVLATGALIEIRAVVDGPTTEDGLLSLLLGLYDYAIERVALVSYHAGLTNVHIYLFTSEEYAADGAQWVARLSKGADDPYPELMIDETLLQAQERMEEILSLPPSHIDKATVDQVFQQVPGLLTRLKVY